MPNFFSPFRSLDIKARLRHIEDHLSRFVPVTVENSSVEEQAAAFTGGAAVPVGGSQVEIFDDLGDVEVVDAVVGHVPVFDGTNWLNQDYVQGNWGVGLTTNPTFRFQVSSDSLDTLTTWFSGTADSLALGSRGWHLNKVKTQASESTWAWHSDGAPVWEIGMAADTNNSTNFGFGAADFLVFDTTANTNNGYIVARASYEEAATNGTATKWLFGRNLTTSPAASTALFEIKNPSATLRGLRVTTTATQSVPLVDFIDGISELRFTSVINPLSSLKGLHIIKTDETSATSHGISWDVGTSGTGYAQWETGVDYDTNNANKRADFILVNDATANSGAGADCLRFSHEADDTVVGSASLKAILSHVAGGPRAFTSFFTVEAGDTLAGMNISCNNSASGRNMMTFTQRAANYYGAISFDNALRVGADWLKATKATYFIYDDIAGALRLFMDDSGRFSIGTSTSPTAYLMLPAGTAAASTAPLKLTSGTNLTSAEAGAFEFDGTELYFSPSTTRTTVLRSTFSEAQNVTFGTTTGTKLGVTGGAAGEKLGFLGAAPVVQQLLATGAGATVDNVITVLQTIGLCRQT